MPIGTADEELATQLFGTGPSSAMAKVPKCDAKGADGRYLADALSATWRRREGRHRGSDFDARMGVRLIVPSPEYSEAELLRRLVNNLN